MRLKQSATPWLFIAPSLIIFSIFHFFPLAILIYTSFTRWNLISPPQFIGLENYLRVISDELFIKSLFITIIFVFTSLIINVILSLGIALLTEKPDSKLATLCRFIIFIPYVLPDAASAGIWNLMFFPHPSSPINVLLTQLGIGWQGWIGDKNLALPTIILYYIWKNVGFSTLVYVAGLKAIPKIFYDAAEVDGASRLDAIKHIMVPLLKPITLFILITSLIAGWQSFTDIFILTRGGPGTATTTLSIYIYHTAFGEGLAGRAAVVAIILFIITLILTIIQLKYIKSE
ncbi:MAG: sugar ABC transporter permease [Nitrososphaerota archaeon]